MRNNFTKTALVRITARALKIGIIPRMCPICKNPTRRLAVHHWGGNGIEVGERYRRICLSCNFQLGILFKGEYPDLWAEQYQNLSEGVFKAFPKNYPFFDGREGEWSRITEEERVLALEKGLAGYWVDFSFINKDSRPILVEATTRARAIDKATEGLGVSLADIKGLRTQIKVALDSPWIKEHKDRYEEIRKRIEKLMKLTLRDIEDEPLRVRLLTVLLQAREMLNGKESSSK